ncbi:hypothetical protein UY3_09643 [Chelonia mydas]|uniref:Uncharacterized protein n=1 Tax=Chelonia mydas TaxID=8469 RepID=M7B7U9_CHEMY|nr:hypothetical protein UY3_09643 [Chelonia mydas]
MAVGAAALKTPASHQYKKDPPPPDAVAAKPTIELVLSIAESPLPTPPTLEPDLELPPLSCLASEAQNLASAPTPVPDPGPTPDADPVPIQSTSRDVIAAPGAVSFPFLANDPQGVAFVFPCPDPLGAAIFLPPHPIAPGFEVGHVEPAHQAPRRRSAPCLPVLVGHGAVPRAPSGDDQETVIPPPHALREQLREFLEDIRGSRNKVQLTLQQWGDFHQILRAARALMGEGKRTGKQADPVTVYKLSFSKEL